jgi:hypothetical protein
MILGPLAATFRNTRESCRQTFRRLAQRADVEAVYAQISELDPGEDAWPFTDTVLVAGTISTDELRSIVAPLQPDEVGRAAEFGAPQAVIQRHGNRLLAVWWD